MLIYVFYKNNHFVRCGVIPAVRRLRLEDCKFETSLGYLGRPWLIKIKNKGEVP
jgi:hypothetical protein